MTEQPDKMGIWNKVCTTDPAYTKDVSFGKRKFTDIDSMWNIRRATELWGPFGTEWGFTEITYSFAQDKEQSVGVIMKGSFYYPGGEFEVAADMPYETRGETLKKLQTMCIGKALSRLGFSADVYMGKFEDSAYVAEMQAKFAKGENSDTQPNNTNDSNAGTGTVPDTPTKVTTKTNKYPEPDPVASGILGTLTQKYMDVVFADKARYKDMIVSFKKVCRAVYDVFGKYPTKADPANVQRLFDAVPIEAVIEKNDFLDGVN